MTLTITRLNDMAANYPEGMAFPEQGRPLTFAQLKDLVDQHSRHLFDGGAGIYGKYIRHETTRRIVKLCADRIGISKLENIPISIPKEELSATLKTEHIQVLYTDLMDKLLEIVNVSGPFIGIVTPIELYHHKIWRVRFRSDRGRVQIDLDEVNSRHRKWQSSQPHSNR